MKTPEYVDEPWYPDMETYQLEIQQFIVDTVEAQKLDYGLLNLTAEVGELTDHYAKALRKGCGVDLELVHKELGDILFMVALLCSATGTSLGVVAEQNIGKLLDRKARGVIVGSGDKR